MRRRADRARQILRISPAAVCVSALILLVGGCGGDDAPGGRTGGGAAGGGAMGGGGVGGAGGGAEPGVRVVDPDGSPVAGAWVMMGGQPASLWAQTDTDGRASIELVDDGVSDPWVLAGKEGWRSGGVPVDPTAPLAVTITMRPEPTADNADYAFQPGGHGMSPDTSECGHCHPSIADDWAGSAHRTSASNPRTWDLYAGSALGATSVAACDALGGHQGDGQVPGVDTQTATRCYVDEGVLPWLNAGCGGPGEQGCDHPDQRPGLTRLGACGDCHAPAMDGVEPGHIDLAGAFGVAFEGVTCDLCHKTRAVVPGPSAGRDGGLVLLRPNEEATVSGQIHQPITFGPYPDVIVPIMFGSYAPQLRDAAWCSSCHEYAQQALHPSETLLDPSRFPDGLPILETYSEFLAWSDHDGLSCQTCHMETLDEESSTYDISAKGLGPSVDQGWLRASGEVRHHDFPTPSLATPGLALTLADIGAGLEATATVSNQAAGHAIPTGEPLRQLIVLVTATDGGGNTVAPLGGQVVPDLGGTIRVGTIGTDTTVNGSTMTFSGQTFPYAPTAVRIARPTGVWDDYAGPGTAAFSSGGLTPADKGMAKTDLVAERAVVSVAGDVLTLAAPAPALQAGDIVYAVGSEAHRAGASGWIYSKALTDASGRRGVAHYRAVHVASDNRIAPGQSGSSAHLFPLPTSGQSITVTATLIRRRYAAPVADLHGWDVGDELVATAQQTFQP